MTHDVTLIPLEEIDAGALVRDRSVADETAQVELALSIAAGGLRMPVEVFAYPEPMAGRRYGLISGTRRLAAFRALAAKAPEASRFAAIPAFVRRPAGAAEALHAMVEENDMRAGITPWEQARVAVVARGAGLFPTLDAAVDALYANASRHRRARVRAVAGAVEAVADVIDVPERLSLRQLLRLSNAVAAGYLPLIRVALQEAKGFEAQAQALAPFLAEAERHGEAEPDPVAAPDRPRRRITPTRGLAIRREMTAEGWLLRFSGPDAKSDLMDRVFDLIEGVFAPQERKAPGGR